MILVMVVVSIIVGSSVFLLANDSSDEIQTLPNDIEQLAKKSLNAAKLNKQTHYIHISPDYLWISSSAKDTKPSAKTKDLISLPKNCSIGYKRSNETQWNQIKTENDKAIWVFSTAGICEDLSLSLRINQSSAELKFHPLTAAIIQP